MNPDEIRAQCEAAWAERNHVMERESALQDLWAGPRRVRGADPSPDRELLNRQPQVVVGEERRAASASRSRWIESTAA